VKRANSYNQLAAGAFTKTITKDAVEEMRAVKDLWYKVLLYQWHGNACVHANRSRVRRDFNPDPFSYLDGNYGDPLHPYCYLSIWNVERSIRLSIGTEVTDVYIQGMSETENLTKDRFSLAYNMSRIVGWREAFESEASRLREREETRKKAEREKDAVSKEALQDSVRLSTEYAILEGGIGWPIGRGRSGIPPFQYTMCIAMQGTFARERTLLRFSNSFGTLPQSVTVGLASLGLQRTHPMQRDPNIQKGEPRVPF
jgi:hypothetical protein